MAKAHTTWKVLPHQQIEKLSDRSDAKAFRIHLEQLADLPRLKRIVVSHHVTIDQDPAGTLRAVAATP